MAKNNQQNTSAPSDTKGKSENTENDHIKKTAKIFKAVDTASDIAGVKIVHPAVKVAMKADKAAEYYNQHPEAPVATRVFCTGVAMKASGATKKVLKEVSKASAAAIGIEVGVQTKNVLWGAGAYVGARITIGVAGAIPINWASGQAGFYANSACVHSLNYLQNYIGNMFNNTISQSSLHTMEQTNYSSLNPYNSKYCSLNSPYNSSSYKPFSLPTYSYNVRSGDTIYSSQQGHFQHYQSTLAARLSNNNAKEPRHREMGNSTGNSYYLNLLSQANPNPKDSCVYLRETSKAGYPTQYNYRSFVAVLAATGLCASYNGSNPESGVNSAETPSGDIGGVAAHVGKIKGLKNSADHVLCSEHILCFPTENQAQPFTNNELMQICHELYNAIYVHDTMPFFSLHFNNDGHLYPVMHPAFQNTLVGDIISLLDYLMKGYLNGGIFTNELLRSWHETKNADRTYLKTQLIDIKKLCKEKLAGLPYVSFRELMCKYGMEDAENTQKKPSNDADSLDNDTFRSSFRIIAGQNSIAKEENILFFNPKIEVQYTIDTPPEYKEKLERYKKEHGGNPEAYAKLDQLYKEMALDIQENMPKMPFCKEYFAMLNVITSLCYYYSTLKDMGKIPDLPTNYTHRPVITPKVYPPIPVRYYTTHNIKVTLKDIIEGLQAKEKRENTKDTLDGFLLAVFEESAYEFPENLRLSLRDIIISSMLAHAPLTKEDIDKEYVDSILHRIHSNFISFATSMSFSFHGLIQMIKKSEPKENMDFNNENVDNFRTLKEKKDYIKKHVSRIQQEVKDTLNISLEKLKSDIIDQLTKEGKQADPDKLNAHINDIRSKEHKEITHWQEEMNKEIERLSLIISSLGSLLLQHPKVSDNLAQPYRHSVLSIADSHYYKEIGDNLRIVGGCGVSLPSLTPLPLKNTSEHAHILFEKFTNHPHVNFAQISVNKKHYTAFKIASKDRFITSAIEYTDFPSISPTDMGEEEEQALESLFTQITQKEPVTLKKCDAKKKDSNGQTMLHRAVYFHSKEGLYLLLKENPGQLDTRDKKGNMPIHTAAMVGNTEAINFFLTARPSLLEATTPDGLTPLMLAIQYDQLLTVERLLVLKANPNICLSNGIFPLYNALLNHSESIALSLLNNAQNLDVTKVIDTGNSALHLAIENKCTKTALALIAKNANVTLSRKTDGYTPFHLAAIKGEIEVIRSILTQKRCEVDMLHAPSSKTAFFFAASHGHLDIVTLLREIFKADINHKDSNSDAAIMVSIENGHKEMALYLASHVSINALNKKRENTAMVAARTGYHMVADILVARGESVENKDVNGLNYIYYLLQHGEFSRFSALHQSKKIGIAHNFNSMTGMAIALKNRHYLLADYFLEHDASLQKDALFIQTAIKMDNIFYAKSYFQKEKCSSDTIKEMAIIAITHESHKCLAFLLNTYSKALLEPSKIHDSLLTVAMKQGSIPTLSLLFNHYGDNALTLDKRGNTIGHIAAEIGRIPVVSFLYKRNITFTEKNTQGYTAFHCTIDKDDSKFLKTLLKTTKEETWPKDLLTYAMDHQKHQCQDLLLKKRLFTHILPTEKTCSESPDALFHAIEARNYSKTKALLEKNGDVTKEGAKGRPLDYAILSGDKMIIDLLLTYKANPLLKSKGLTGFERAVMYNKIDVILLFHARGFTAELQKFSSMLLHLPSNPYTKEAILNKTTSLERDKKRLSEALSRRNMRSIYAICNSFPLNDVAITYEGTTKLLLHHLFAMETSVDEAFVKAILSKIKEKLNPLAMDDSATPLAFELLHKEEKDIKQKLKWITEYFPKKIESILLQKSDKEMDVLTVASLLKNNALVMVVLEHTAHLHKEDTHGTSLLHKIASTGNSEALTFLIQKKYDLDKRDENHITPLMMACAQGSIKCVELLVKGGAHTELKDTNQDTALHYAIKAGHSEIVQFLVTQMKEIDSRNRQHLTPFHLAALKGDCISLKKLTPLLPSIDCRDKKGRNALHLAAISGEVDAVAYLLTLGMDIHAIDTPESKPSTRKTALHFAATYGHVNVFLLLLEKGADSLQKDIFGKTPVTCGAASKNKQMVSVIRTLPAFYIMSERNALFLEAATHNNVFLARELLLIGCDINMSDTVGRSALHYAAGNGSTEMIMLLAKHDVSLHVLDRDGNSALHYAALGNHVNAIKLLALHGLSCDYRNKEGETALYFAAKEGKYASILQLLCIGADHTLENNQGMTPAHEALLKGYRTLVELFFILRDLSLAPEKLKSLPEWYRKEVEPHIFITQNFLSLTNEAIALQRNPMHLAVSLRHHEALALLCQIMPSCISLTDKNHISPLNLATSVADHKALRIMHHAQKHLRHYELSEVQEEDTHLKRDEAPSAQPPIDKESVQYRLATLLAPLPKEAGALFLMGVDTLSKDEKPLFIKSWVSLLENIASHPEFYRDFTRVFLENYSSRSLFNVPFIVLMRKVKDAKSSVLNAWFFNFFTPINIHPVSAEMIEKGSRAFEAFFLEVSDHLPSLPYPHKDTAHLNFVREDNIVQRALCALKGSQDKKAQIELLNDLPSVALIEEGYKKKAKIIASDMDIKNANPSLPLTYAKLSALHDYKVTKSSMLFYFASSHTESYQKGKEFFTLIEKIESMHLSPSEKVILCKLYFAHSSKEIKMEHISPFVTCAVAIRKEMGARIFRKLYRMEAMSSDYKVDDHTLLAKLILDVKDTMDIDSLFIKHQLNLSITKTYLIAEQKRLLTKNTSANSLDNAASAFLTLSKSVQFPLSKEEMAQLKKDYVATDTLASSYEGKELMHEANNVRILLKQHPGDKQQNYHIFALLREAVRQSFKILPYNTQILALMALINNPKDYKGRIAQIATGEGKSLITALLSAYFVLKGYQVDVVTSSANLAIRDQQKYCDFYKALGIDSSHICFPQPKKQHFKNSITYGTSYDFEFGVLRGKKQNFDLAIVDEVDLLFIDTSFNSARIAIADSKEIHWIYEPFSDYIKNNPSNDVSVLRTFLCAYKQGKYSNELSSTNDNLLKRWLESARKSLVLKENRDYVVMKDREDPRHSFIVIVDCKNTGRLNKGSKWQKKLHQFVEYKHGFQPTSDSLSYASISHPAFFNEYKNLYGVTGTVGEEVERNEIKRIFNVDIFDVPPHFPSKRITHPSIYYENKTSYMNAIVKNILETQQQQRPCLILFRTIAESEEFSALLKSKSMQHHLINDIQQSDEDYIIHYAGREGRITIGTNTTGRGIDIILSKESEKNGGLHVIFAFFAANKRVQTQGEGRAGRQGQQGSCRTILWGGDEEIKNSCPSLIQEAVLPGIKDPLAFLEGIRSHRITALSAQRVVHSAFESISYGVFKKFVEQLDGLKEKLTTIDATILNTAHSSTDYPLLENFHEQLLPLSRHANNLQHRVNEGQRVEWSGFIKECKKYYLLHLKHKWSKFFNDHCEYEKKEDVDTYKNLIFQKYDISLGKELKRLTTSFEKNFQDFVHMILKEGKGQFTSQTETNLSYVEKIRKETQKNVSPSVK